VLFVVHNLATMVLKSTNAVIRSTSAVARELQNLSAQVKAFVGASEDGKATSSGICSESGVGE